MYLSILLLTIIHGLGPGPGPLDGRPRAPRAIPHMGRGRAQAQARPMNDKEWSKWLIVVTSIYNNIYIYENRQEQYICLYIYV